MGQRPGAFGANPKEGGGKRVVLARFGRRLGLGHGSLTLRCLFGNVNRIKPEVNTWTISPPTVVRSLFLLGTHVMKKEPLDV
jgi:hypothetical protein